MSSASLISSFGVSVTVKRFAAGSYVNGQWTEGAITPLTATMSLQPLSDKEMVIESDGERTKRFLRGYTDTQLLTVQNSPTKRADRVTFDGVDFEVQRVETWPQNMNLGHYKVILAEVNA